MYFIQRFLIAFFLFVQPSGAILADVESIVVLNFELYDSTLKPGTPDEVKRTASVKPLLQKVLETRWGYRMVIVDPEDQSDADKGFGYLFDHHDEAAWLGKEAGADWVVVGRVHKESFLFAYLKAHLVDAKTGELIGEYIIKIEGPPKLITAKGVETLAQQISSTLRQLKR